MKLIKLALRRETAAPILALLFATLVTGALVVGRIYWTRNINYGFLGWNLFLAWLPLVFALLACDEHRNGTAQTWRFYTFSGAWLLFFPNSPYILTDLIHLPARFYGHFWVDLVLILLSALTGLVLGFVSLFLMQAVVRRMLGRTASWVFIAAVTGLSGFGIYLGRFLRFNSWDIVLKPFELYQTIISFAADPLSHPHSLAFSALFAVFLFIAYLMLYGLTHLQSALPAPAPANAAQIRPRAASDQDLPPQTADQRPKTKVRNALGATSKTAGVYPMSSPSAATSKGASA